MGKITKQELSTELSSNLDNIENSIMSHQADLVSHGVYGTATGTNTLTLPINTVSSYVEGMLVAFKNTTANTGAVTLNINNLGAKSIKRANGNDLSSGNLKAGGMYQVRYDGTNFILLGEGGEYGTVTANDVRNTKTFGTENGIVQGGLDLSKLIASNIRKGISIDGILGTLDIASLGGKNFATGTTVSDSNSLINFTGLSFTPTFVFGWMSETDTLNNLRFHCFIVSSWSFGTNTSNVVNSVRFSPTSAGSQIIEGYGSSNIITTYGFKTETTMANKTFSFIAIG